MTKRITNLQLLTSGVAVVFVFIFMHLAPDLSPEERVVAYVGLLGFSNIDPQGLLDVNDVAG